MVELFVNLKDRVTTSFTFTIPKLIEPISNLTSGPNDLPTHLIHALLASPTANTSKLSTYVVLTFSGLKDNLTLIEHSGGMIPWYWEQANTWSNDKSLFCMIWKGASTCFVLK